MSEPHVTITLGRTGQVLKRGRSRRFLDSDGFLSANKRRHVDHTKWRAGDHKLDGPRFARNDLRLKLIRKRRVEKRRKRVHEKMLGTVQPPGYDNLLPSHPQAKRSGLIRQYPSEEILNYLQPQDSSRTYYSSRTIDRSRDRYSGRIQTTTELSSPRTFNVPRRVLATRAADVPRSGQFLSNEAVGASRQTAPITVKATARMANPVAPSGSIMPKSSLMDVEHLTVSGVLQSLGLGKYTVTFQAEEVDMPALKQMSDNDLKELGIPMGPRRKILLAVKSHSKLPLA